MRGINRVIESVPARVPEFRSLGERALFIARTRLKCLLKLAMCLRRCSVGVYALRESDILVNGRVWWRIVVFRILGMRIRFGVVGWITLAVLRMIV